MRRTRWATRATRAERARRAGLASILAVLMLSCGPAAEAPAPGPDAPPAATAPAAPPETPAERDARREAAHRGVDWLIGHAPEMPPGWAFANLSRARRLVDDPALRERLDAALAADAASGNHRPVPDADALGDPEWRDADALTPVLFELLRRRETGAPWRAPAEALAALAAQDELRFWKAVPLRHRPTLVYLFEALEMPTNMSAEAVVEALRRGADAQGPDALGANHRYVYALTHVVFARTGYFRRPAEADDLGFAVPVFRAALEQRRGAVSDVMALDLVGEVVASWRWMGLAPDERVRAARRDLMAAQNPDGSWGPGDDVTPRRIHPTFNAIAALLDPPTREATGEATVEASAEAETSGAAEASAAVEASAATEDSAEAAAPSRPGAAD